MLINIEFIHHHGLLYLLALTVSSLYELSIMVRFAVASRSQSLSKYQFKKPLTFIMELE